MNLKIRNLRSIIPGLIISLLFCLAGGIKAADDPAAKPLLTDKFSKISYCIGLNIGEDLKNQLIEVSPEILLQGIKDAVQGNKRILTDQEISTIMEEFQKEIAEKQEARMKELAVKNKKEGEDFLEKNKKTKGIKTLQSGLQYKIVINGSGKKPKANDIVKVHYKGTFIDGKEFDNSYKRGEPAEFGVSEVIPGWTEALQLMPVGSKWDVYIPADLAYGEHGAGNIIGPNSTLCYTIELISIKEESSNQ